jgi:hypothetical protein
MLRAREVGPGPSVMRVITHRQGLLRPIALILSFALSACTPRSLPPTIDSAPEQPRELPQAPSSANPSTDTVSVRIDDTVPTVDPELQPAKAPTFLGQTEPVSLAIADFEVRGMGLPGDIGKSVPDRLVSRLTSRRFRLLERSRLNRIVEEHDLQSAGVVGGASEALTSASYILLGSVGFERGVEISARLAEVRTGRISRSAWATSGSSADLDPVLDEIASVLSAPDAEYEQIEAELQRRQTGALKHALEPPLTVTREGNALVVTIRTPASAESEQRLYQQVRQQLREQFAKYCKNELGSPRSKEWLMDYCRQMENCTDVNTDAGYKTFSFRVPLPP